MTRRAPPPRDARPTGGARAVVGARLASCRFAPDADLPAGDRLDLERRAVAAGARLIAGVDEVGRGAIAGPVVAAAVVLWTGNDWTRLPPELAAVRDSKMLRPEMRAELAAAIWPLAAAVSIGITSATGIDRLGIAAANRLAMRRAVAALPVEPDLLLIDWEQLPECPLPQWSVVRGDAASLSIGAASIVAKVLRDELLADLDTHHPGYGWAHNAGYGTRAHLAALDRLGPTPHHRHSWAPVRARLGAGSPAGGVVSGG